MGATHLLFHNQGRGRPIGGGVAPAFVPTDIDGCQLWLDGSDITTLFQDSAKTTPVTADGNVVGAWADKSGNGNDATRTPVANKPLYKTSIQNGESVVRFDGINDALLLGGMTVGVGSLTFFIATNPTSIAATLKYFIDIHVGRLIVAHTTDDAAFKVGWYDGAFDSVAAAQTGAQSLCWHFTSGGNGEVFRDGSSLGTAAYTAKAIGGNVGLFSEADGSSKYVSGDAFEVIIYDSALSTGNRQAVETYLNNKWAIY